MWLLGYAVEKCYKIHGYPTGYKTKSRNPTANQVSCSEMVLEVVPSSAYSMFPFTLEQFQKLLAMIEGSDAQPNPIGMTNNVSYNASQSRPLAGNTILNQALFDTKHSIFFC